MQLNYFCIDCRILGWKGAMSDERQTTEAEGSVSRQIHSN